MEIKNVTVFGSGVLGAQIAFQTAFHGYSVTLYDIQEDFLDKAKLRFQEFRQFYKDDVNATDTDLDAAISRLSYTTDLAASVKDADLTIEAIPENIQIKKDFYAKLSPLAPEKTIFATNTSTLLPSELAPSTGRPERFLALHFGNKVWKYNLVEIMGHTGTDQAIFDKVVEFSKTIGMVPIPIKREQPGYILNSLLVPFQSAALDLYINGIADAEAIDKTWLIATGSEWGPLSFLDVVGLTTAYNIFKVNAELSGDPVWARRADFVKENFIDKNKLGVSTGEGFYKYPNPAYQDDSFLK